MPGYESIPLNPPAHWINRALCLACTLFCVLIFKGCIVVPTSEHALLEGRGKIEDLDMAFLENGKTTREDVVLRFGEPDLILNHDRVLIYHWAVSHGYWFIGGAMAAAGGPIPKDYFLMLEFDEGAILKRFEKTGSVFKQPQLRKWAYADTGKPPGGKYDIYLIDPTPRHRPRPSTAPEPIRFRVENFRFTGEDSARGDLVGFNKAWFGVIVAEIRTCRPFVDIVRSAVAAQLESAGHSIEGSKADVVVTGELAEFRVRTTVGFFSTWDAVASLDLTLTYHAPSNPDLFVSRRYRAEHIVKTSIGPSENDFERIMRACLEDMQAQMALEELPEVLKGLRPGAGDS